MVYIEFDFRMCINLLSDFKDNGMVLISKGERTMSKGPCDMCNVPDKIEGYDLGDYQDDDLGYVMLCDSCIQRIRWLKTLKTRFRYRISIDYYIVDLKEIEQ